MKDAAVCLLSGGLDSCVTTTLAKKDHAYIHALSFSYGQHHTKELTCAKKIAEDLQVDEHLIIELDLKPIGGSTLFQNSKEGIQNHKLTNIGDSIPNTYVPARNTIFLSIALGLAETREADSIYIGANAVDYSGYPDCRADYLKSFQNMANLATKRAIQGQHIEIKAPLLTLSKKDIVTTGIAHNAPLHHSWSCYRGEEKACGHCDSCQLRLKGFKDAGYTDPIDYQDYPDWYTQ